MECTDFKQYNQDATINLQNFVHFDKIARHIAVNMRIPRSTSAQNKQTIVHRLTSVRYNFQTFRYMFQPFT